MTAVSARARVVAAVSAGARAMAAAARAAAAMVGAAFPVARGALRGAEEAPEGMKAGTARSRQSR